MSNDVQMEKLAQMSQGDAFEKKRKRRSRHGTATTADICDGSKEKTGKCLVYIKRTKNESDQ
jgi:hypothetical protein